jgi:hypothetical protein
MLLFIALTAGLGAIFPRFIDNWGHGCGLIVGAAIGLAHRRLSVAVGRPSAWGAGVLAGLFIAGCGAAQYAADRREAPARLERELTRRSDYLARATGELRLLRQPDCPKVHMIINLKWLDVLEPLLDGTDRPGIQGLRALIRTALARPLDEGERHDLDERLTRVLGAMRRRYEGDRRQLGRLRGRR